VEGEMIIISIISGIFSIIGISLLNHNWFKRQRLKYDLEVRKIKARSKAKLPRSNPAPEINSSSPLANVGSLLNIARGLDPEQIGDLINMLTGKSAEPEAAGGILEEIVANNPELVQSFIDGFTKGKKNEPQEEAFKSQLP
jgi:hypothetical protein